jgi:hypothetical protein
VNGTPKAFARKDRPAPVSREFCPDCGTHLVSRSPRLPDAVLLKVGTLDDPAFFQKPEFGIFAIDKQPFHSAPDGLTLHERRPSSYQ